MLLGIEIFTLALFAVVALIKVYSGHPTGSLHVSTSWFNPFNLSWNALIAGVLLGVFIYWGWDSGVAVNE
ncbi:MAG: APC family permease, partial [Solirubrobacterales bacterium]|nr:APC family permease [Solirubrobacterales bacterium]